MFCTLSFYLHTGTNVFFIQLFVNVMSMFVYLLLLWQKFVVNRQTEYYMLFIYGKNIEISSWEVVTYGIYAPVNCYQRIEI